MSELLLFIRLITSFYLVLVFVSLQANECLLTWNDGFNKQAILSFIECVSNPQLETFIPEQERIAVIDHDGTLWCEKPHYTQVSYILKKIEDLLPFPSDWLSNHPLKKAATEQGINHELMELSLVTHMGLTVEQLTQSVKEFMSQTVHPRFGLTYDKMVYQPMVELITLLHQKGFKVFIVSGGGIEFVRTISEEAYQIPQERVIGTSLQTWYIGEPTPHLILVPLLVLPINNGSGKPVNIQRHIGRIPVLAIGNSDGDIEMLSYVQQSHRLSLSIFIHHDDEEREYCYDEGATQLLKLVEEHPQWLKVSMKHDFKVIFPIQTNNR